MRIQIKLTATLKRETEGGYTATCKEVPAAITYGHSKREALRMLPDAIYGVLASYAKHRD